MHTVLAENFFSGQLPEELSDLPNLRLLSIFRREKPGPKLTGTLPSFSNNPRLTDLYLDHNELRGSIPANFLILSRSAAFIDLSSNQISGVVPVSLQTLSEVFLDLTDNEIQAFAPGICNNADWMDGDVGAYGCHGFLCEPSTASPIGRQNENNTCTKCGDADVALGWGSTSCHAPLSERATLISLYQNTGGRDWRIREGWASGSQYCSWHGVTCNDAQQVKAIDLGANNLVGTPPPSLFNLPALESLWLYSNPISFSFVGIESATKLTDLRLDATGLGSVQGLDNAFSLMNLDLRFNNLKGTFPEEILYLQNLRTLQMGDNKLTGPLPETFRDLPFLKELRLGSNMFSGPLPTFKDLPVLRKLDVSGNQLTGTIPFRLLRLVNDKSAITVDLSSNSLTGIVPDQLDRFSRMTLYLRRNRIVSLPQNLCDNNSWNKGDVENFGCDAILCPPGTANDNGRARPGNPCQSCNNDNNPYYGQVSCTVPSSTSGATRAVGGFIMKFVVATVATTVCILTTMA